MEVVRTGVTTGHETWIINKAAVNARYVAIGWNWDTLGLFKDTPDLTKN